MAPLCWFGWVDEPRTVRVAKNLTGYGLVGPVDVATNGSLLRPSGDMLTITLAQTLISPSTTCRRCHPLPSSGAGRRREEVRSLLSGETTSSEVRDEPPGPDPDELHMLATEHGDPVFRLALSIVRDRALAEDIAQETMLRAWTALPTLRNRSAMRSWILRIAHNTSISMLRSRKAVVTDPFDMPEDSGPTDRSVESRVQSGAVVDDFVAALDDLDDLSRSIVVLRELEGLSYDEIVDILDVPLPTVKTRLLRARRRLGASMRGWE